MTILLSFFYDPPTSLLYTLSLHDALPIFRLEDDGDLVGLALEMAIEAVVRGVQLAVVEPAVERRLRFEGAVLPLVRSEEHTSELQSLTNLVCRLLLEKKKNKIDRHLTSRK